MKEKNGFDENDSFWSLDSMLPSKSKKQSGYSNAKPSDVSVSEIEIPGELKPKGEPIPRLKYPPITAGPKKALSFDAWLSQRREVEKTRYTAGKELLLSYEPENPLIKSVRISAEKNRRPTSERFVTEGMKHARSEGRFEGNVPFDSIYPQYAALNDKQLSCYIGFRTEVKNCRFPQIDRAYIYLLLYEIINLTEIYPPSDRAELIASLIVGYPNCEDRLFADMCNWLCDICLIYRLPIPEKIYGESYQRVLKMASVKECYLYRPEIDGENKLLSIMFIAGRYNYKTSKYYPQFHEYYDKHIENSCCAALKLVSEKESLLSEYEKDVCTLTHESYFGALCTNAVRRTVEIECYCLTRSENVKKTVTDVVKYSENCLRSRLGIKQRMTVNTLSLEIKNFLKQYYLENMPSLNVGAKPRRKRELRDLNEVPDYEKLYEPASNGLDLSSASEIERSSWDITERLVSAFENEEIQDTESISEMPSIAPEDTIENAELSDEKDTSETANISPAVMDGLRALLLENITLFNEIANKNNMLAAAFADKINEEFFDMIGDSVIENAGFDIKLSEFYRDDIDDIVNG